MPGAFLLAQETLAPVHPGRLAAAYALLLLPLGVMLWWRLPLIPRMLLAVIRMTVQLLLVGLYLQVVFELDHPALNLLWLGVMIAVADAAILRDSGLRLRRLALPLGLGLVVGTAIPLVVFIAAVTPADSLVDARFFIPVGGMILGNCLRANIVGVRSFFGGVRDRETRYLQALGFGATPVEALRPFHRAAIEAALAPTLATMATIGLVSLPGMMTGVMLGGADPMRAVAYQIAIMLAIFAGTAVTVSIVLGLAGRRLIDGAGLIDRSLFR